MGRVEYIIKAIVCQENLAQELGLIFGPFQGELGEIWDRGEKGRFLAAGGGSTFVFEAHPGTPISPAPLCLPQPQAIDCYFILTFRDLKSVDNIFICAIMAANSQVAMLARNLDFQRSQGTPKIWYLSMRQCYKFDTLIVPKSA